MNIFSRLWASFGRIADAADAVANSLNALAGSFAEANANVRKNLSLGEQQSLALPAPASPASPVAQQSVTQAATQTEGGAGAAEVQAVAASEQVEPAAKKGRGSKSAA